MWIERNLYRAVFMVVSAFVLTSIMFMTYAMGDIHGRNSRVQPFVYYRGCGDPRPVPSDGRRDIAYREIASATYHDRRGDDYVDLTIVAIGVVVVVVGLFKIVDLS